MFLLGMMLIMVDLEGLLAYMRFLLVVFPYVIRTGDEENR